MKCRSAENRPAPTMRYGNEVDTMADSVRMSGGLITMDENKVNQEWARFRHETVVRTDTLLYVLSGIRMYYQALSTAIVRAHGPDGLENKRARGTFIPPEGMDIRSRPFLVGEPLIDRMSPGGLAEQMVYKSWVAEIYGLWENRYRTNLKEHYGDAPGAIRPRQQVLGDLRLIRNNLLHSESNLSTSDQAGACAILTWFATGEVMQLNFDHVLDFLNQMDWLVDQPMVIGESPEVKVNCWRFDKKAIRASVNPHPRLVSVRPIVGEDDEPEVFRYGASVAFSDGIFGRIAMGIPFGGASASNDGLWNGLTVGCDGYALILPGTEICEPSVLLSCLSKSNRIEGPGLWSRPYQIRDRSSKT